MSVYIPYRRPGGSEDLLALIALESDLVHGLAIVRLSGSVEEYERLALAPWWAGYVMTLEGLDAGVWDSEACADVAQSVRRLATEMDEQAWRAGIRDARYELAQQE
ncbi:hypothetical protein P8F81_23510 (plasmid) [Kosakonia cowanii]|uniref:hypothetical protein n=1 Tax=Kosakonia cowanii TaxID=208223 RepID=UPI002DDD6F46|nr:hypothetical protein [Kosakonia cowanii]WRY61918.1 hypothetical protein P8F81_23510 [Kosakonia cowanii]